MTEVPTEIPLYIKLAYTALVLIVILVYWKSWGPKNFLWFSDVAFFGLAVALWIKSPLIASIMIVMTILVEVAWHVDLLINLVVGKSPFGITDYMRNDDQPLFVRLLSMFHTPMLVLMIYLLAIWGYIPEGFYYAMMLAVLVFFLTWLAKPQENINWIYGFKGINRKSLGKYYLVIIIAGYLFLFVLPTHFLLINIL